MSVVLGEASTEQKRESIRDSGSSNGKILRFESRHQHTDNKLSHLKDIEQEDLIKFQERFKRSIYSHGTALSIWGMSDVSISPFHMTFPFGYNLTNAKAAGLLCSQSSNGLCELGICHVELSNGKHIAVYSPEKTLCDIVRRGTDIDIKTVVNVYRTYSGWEHKDFNKLKDYAEKLRVSKRIKTYLEILSVIMN